MNRFLKTKRYINKQYPFWKAANGDIEWDYEHIEVDVFIKILEYGLKNGLKIPKTYLLKHDIENITHLYTIALAMLYRGYDFKIPKKMKLLMKHSEYVFWEK